MALLGMGQNNGESWFARCKVASACTVPLLCGMQSGICLHCAFALRDAKSIRETNAESGSQAARRDVLEKISTGWGRRSEEVEKRSECFLYFKDNM